MYSKKWVSNFVDWVSGMKVLIDLFVTRVWARFSVRGRSHIMSATEGGRGGHIATFLAKKGAICR